MQSLFLHMHLSVVPGYPVSQMLWGMVTVESRWAAALLGCMGSAVSPAHHFWLALVHQPLTEP